MGSQPPLTLPGVTGHLILAMLPLLPEKVSADRYVLTTHTPTQYPAVAFVYSLCAVLAVVSRAYVLGQSGRRQGSP